MPKQWYRKSEHEVAGDIYLEESFYRRTFYGVLERSKSFSPTRVALPTISVWFLHLPSEPTWWQNTIARYLKWRGKVTILHNSMPTSSAESSTALQ